MSAPSPKKIVSTKQYLILTGKRFWLYTDSLLSAGAAAGMLVYTIQSLVHWLGLLAGHNQSVAVGHAALRNAFFGWVVTAILVRASNRTRRRARAMEAIQPLTDRNVHLLPLEETLVRSSEVPAEEQQAVLLRAVSQGQETPSNQLLRAGQRTPDE